MSQPKIKRQLIKYTVDSAGQVIVIDKETDKLYKNVKGIDIIMTDKKNMFSELELEIDTVEVFPEGWEVLRILFKENAPFGGDIHPLNERGGGSRLKGKYTDVNSGATYPYKITIALYLDND